MNGLILAGGSSSRMGMDKSKLVYHHSHQYQHAFHLLNSYCEEVWISSKKESFTLPTLVDHPKYSNIGPMAGLLTAFDYKYDDWLILAVDYPLINHRDIEKLINSKHEIASVYYNEDTQFYEPWIGLYRKAFKQYLFPFYQSGEQSIQKLLRNIQAEKIVSSEVKHIQSVDHYEDFLRTKSELNSKV